jgi:16S rRNA (cytosine967-C5)-methyltransferase
MAIARTRQIALDSLLRVAQGSSANAVLDAALTHESLETRDRGFVTELVDGTLRWQGRLDYLLGLLVEGSLDKLEPAVRQILRLGAYQLVLLERVPPHAAVNEAVAQARERANEGAAKLVNAVLRRLEREQDSLPYPDPAVDPVAFLAARYSHPAWLVTRWLARFGLADTQALLAINNTPPPLTLRLNRRWVTREGLQGFLKLRDIDTIPTAISPNGLIITSGGNPRDIDLYQEGLFSIQGEGSMVMVELLKPGKNRAGWDMAAGVGGKTTYLAEWVDDSGSLLATDTSAERLEVLRRQLARLELTSVRVEAGDARTFPLEPKSLDFILLDAPCTGTGSLRRQADARWRKAPEQFAEMAKLQRELLEAAALAANPGGLLLYCTCSLEPEENEDVIGPFLADHPEWSLDMEGLKHQTLPDDARDLSGFVRLLPHRHGTDGFFAARMVKSGVE